MIVLGDCALFCRGGGPTFCCMYEGVLGAAAAFDGPILGCVSGGVLRVFRTVVPSGKWQVLTYSAGPIFVWSDARLPYFLVTL